MSHLLANLAAKREILATKIPIRDLLLWEFPQTAIRMCRFMANQSANPV